MKINAHPVHDMHGAALRQAGKAARASAAEVAAPAATPAPTVPAPAGTNTAAPAQSTVEVAVRKAPPGLLRVAARFEALGAEGRSGGQSNALTQITRNLQRYMDHQGLTPAPVPAPASAPTPVPAAQASEPAAATDPGALASSVEPPASA